MTEPHKRLRADRVAARWESTKVWALSPKGLLIITIVVLLTGAFIFDADIRNRLVSIGTRWVAPTAPAESTEPKTND